MKATEASSARFAFLILLIGMSVSALVGLSVIKATGSPFPLQPLEPGSIVHQAEYRYIRFGPAAEAVANSTPADERLQTPRRMTPQLEESVTESWTESGAEGRVLRSRSIALDGGAVIYEAGRTGDTAYTLVDGQRFEERVTSRPGAPNSASLADKIAAAESAGRLLELPAYELGGRSIRVVEITPARSDLSRILNDECSGKPPDTCFTLPYFTDLNATSFKQRYEVEPRSGVVIKRIDSVQVNGEWVPVLVQELLFFEVVPGDAVPPGVWDADIPLNQHEPSIPWRFE